MSKYFNKRLRKTRRENSARSLSEAIIKRTSLRSKKKAHKKIIPTFQQVAFHIKLWMVKVRGEKSKSWQAKKRHKECWAENYEVYEAVFIVWSRLVVRQRTQRRFVVENPLRKNYKVLTFTSRALCADEISFVVKILLIDFTTFRKTSNLAVGTSDKNTTIMKWWGQMRTINFFFEVLLLPLKNFRHRKSSPRSFLWFYEIKL